MSRPAWPNGASFSTGAAATRAYDPEDYPTYAAPSTVGTGVTSPLRAHHNGTVLSKNGSTPRPASSLYLPNKKLKKSR
uniref:Uncharacterized protein n=1 Tax=Plectus sambesii TaxID=2011161 RepID=A0A914UUL4_9BILA